MSQPTKLYHSLFVLQTCDTVIQRVIDRTRKMEKGQLELIADEHFLVDNALLIILELNNFLDEYEKYFHRVELAYQHRVIIFKKIIRPIIDQIKKWTELRKVRNLFIAHNCRDDAGRFYVPDITKYDVPKNTLDFHIISDFMKYISALLLTEFEKEIQEMFSYIIQFIPPARSQHDIPALNNALTAMENEVNQLCEQYGKAYRLNDVMKYLPPSE